MRVEWDTENGIPHEDDLWKFFSDHPDEPSETILFYGQIKPLLKKMRLTDERKFYCIYEHGPVAQPPGGFCATVTQRNLSRVASAISGRGTNSDAAIQYLGRCPKIS